MHASLPKSPRVRYKPCPFTVVRTPRMVGHVGVGSSCLGQRAQRANLQRFNLEQENVYMKMIINMREFDPQDVYGQRIKGEVLPPRWQPLAPKGDKVCTAVYFKSFPETAFDVELRKETPHVFENEASLAKAREDKITAAMWKLAKVYGKVKHVCLKPPNHILAYRRRAGLVFYEYMEEAEMLCFDLNNRVVITYDIHGNIDETVTLKSHLDTNTTSRLPKGEWWLKWERSKQSDTSIMDAVPYVEGISTKDLPTLRREERELERLRKNDLESDDILLSTVKLNSEKERLEATLMDAVHQAQEIEIIVKTEEEALKAQQANQAKADNGFQMVKKRNKNKKPALTPSTTPTTQSKSRAKLTVANDHVKDLRVQINNINDDSKNMHWPNVNGIFSSNLPTIPSPLIQVTASESNYFEEMKEADDDTRMAIVVQEQEATRTELSETVEEAFFFGKETLTINDNDDTTEYDLRRLCRRFITA